MWTAYRNAGELPSYESEDYSYIRDDVSKCTWVFSQHALLMHLPSSSGFSV